MKGIIGNFLKRLKNIKLRWIFQAAIILFSVSIIVAIGTITYVMSETDISHLKNELERSTEIYDLEGSLASTVTANKTEGTAIEDIPDHMINAVIAVEDSRFYDHNGIDYKGIARAMLTNLRLGEIVEGGSTLTQQLVKITLLEPDRTYIRKLKEFFLAKEVEDTYSKDEILEMYLNQVYFGHGAWGIKKAAAIYFGKDVQDLTISEAAVLAGVINRPSKLDPYQYYTDAVERRNLVLSRMSEHGFITEEEETQAKNEEIALVSDTKEDSLKGKYPYYIDLVLAEASEKYNLELDELLTGGYKIYTSLDQSIQQAAEAVYANEENFPKGSSEDLVQSSMVLLDPKTGGINAVIGGRGDHQFMGFNRATQLERSPGSTIKPLVAYSPALESGFSVTDLLVDKKMSFGDYEPTNISGEYSGEVPMYEALMNSLNVPTVWLLNEIGIETGLNALTRFGIPYNKEKDRNLSIALGGMYKGVSPLDMAQAYSAFANDGVRIEAHAIVKIEDSNGNEVSTWKEQKTKVIDKEIADQMNTMLLGVVDYGTGKNAAVAGYEVAGKTGSTQASIEGVEGAVRDQWFVGYTPTLVAAVWAGYEHTDEHHYLTTHSSQGAAIIFQKVMSQVLQNQDPQSFEVPSIGPLIENREKEQKREERKKYWQDKGNQVKDILEKWSDNLFNN
jgi:penicillin-binding protein 2A